MCETFDCGEQVAWVVWKDNEGWLECGGILLLVRVSNDATDVRGIDVMDGGDDDDDDDGCLLWSISTMSAVTEEDLGLSLPVGPLPRGGRLAGGRLSAARKELFSSSSSATRCSKAWR